MERENHICYWYFWHCFTEVVEDQTIVVGVLTNAAGLDELGAALDRREERVDMDDADRVVIALVLLIGHVAATIPDAVSYTHLDVYKRQVGGSPRND